MKPDREQLISLISDTYKDIHNVRPKNYEHYRAMSVGELKKELARLEKEAEAEIKRPEREKKEAEEMKKKYSEKGKTSTMADAMQKSGVVKEGALNRAINKLSKTGKKCRLKESAKFTSFQRLDEAAEDNKDDIFALVEELKKREVALAKDVAGMLVAILTHKARYKGEDVAGSVSAGKDKQLEEFCAMVKRFMTKRHMNLD